MWTRESIVCIKILGTYHRLLVSICFPSNIAQATPSYFNRSSVNQMLN
jgi:hypothetical protein